MIKSDIQAIDDATYKDRNVKAELEYCGTFIRHRKEITNQDLRFYAWLFRAALREIEKLEEDNDKP